MMLEFIKSVVRLQRIGVKRGTDFHVLAILSSKLLPSLGSRRFHVTFEHRRADFRAAGPMAPPLAGVGPIDGQASGIGLHNMAVFQNSRPALSVGICVTNASASLRASRKRVTVAAGSIGGSLAMRWKSSAV